MTENPDSTPSSSESASSTPGPTGPKLDLAEEFKKMRHAEKILVIAAVVVFVAFLFLGRWDWLFKWGWFTTCAFLGAVLTIVMTVLELFSVKVVDVKLRVWIMVCLGVLPALGFIIDALSNFWYALMLAGAVAMGFAAVKITTRENIIKK